MTKEERIELVTRMLGIRHKLKVHDSMKTPDTHDELSVSLLSRWELEDELRAIEEVLNSDREANVKTKVKGILEDYLGGKGPLKKKRQETP